MRVSGLNTEIITTMQGLEFSEAIASSITAMEQGVPCHVLSLEDLIRNKQLLGRESDLEDVAALEKLAK